MPTWPTTRSCGRRWPVTAKGPSGRFAEPGGLAGALARRVLASAGRSPAPPAPGWSTTRGCGSPRPSSSSWAPRRTACGCGCGGDAARRRARRPAGGRDGGDVRPATSPPPRARGHRRAGREPRAPRRRDRLHGIVHADPIEPRPTWSGARSCAPTCSPTSPPSPAASRPTTRCSTARRAPASRPPCAPARRRSPTAACG